MARFNDLNEDVFETIFKHSRSKPDDLSDLAQYCLICRKTRYVAQRILYRDIGLITRTQWLSAHKLLGALLDPERAACVQSITLSGPSSFDWSKEYHELVALAFQLVQACRPRHVTLTGNAILLERMAKIDLAGISSLNVHLLDRHHCRAQALATLINSASRTLVNLVIAIHHDGSFNQYRQLQFDDLPRLKWLSVHMQTSQIYDLMTALGTNVQQLDMLTIEGHPGEFEDTVFSQHNPSIFGSVSSFQPHSASTHLRHITQSLLSGCQALAHLWLTPASTVENAGFPTNAEVLHIRPSRKVNRLDTEEEDRRLLALLETKIDGGAKLREVNFYAQGHTMHRNFADWTHKFTRQGVHVNLRNPKDFISAPSEDILSEDLVDGRFVPRFLQNDYSYANSRPYASFSVQDLAASFSPSAGRSR